MGSRSAVARGDALLLGILGGPGLNHGQHHFTHGLDPRGDQYPLGTVFYNRGVATAVIITETLRLAQSKFGVGPIGGEEMQWAFEHLDITADRIKALGAEGLVPPLKLSCRDHEGGGTVQFQQWDGAKWVLIATGIKPMREMVLAMVEAEAAKYAKEKGITPRDC